MHAWRLAVVRSVLLRTTLNLSLTHTLVHIHTHTRLSIHALSLVLSISGAPLVAEARRLRYLPVSVALPRQLVVGRRLLRVREQPQQPARRLLAKTMAEDVRPLVVTDEVAELVLRSRAGERALSRGRYEGAVRRGRTSGSGLNL